MGSTEVAKSAHGSRSSIAALASVWARGSHLLQAAAIWLADAAVQLQHPEAPMYAHLNKLVGKRPALDLQARPPRTLTLILGSVLT